MFPRKGRRRQRLTQGIRGIDLEDQPVVDILLVGAKDGEDGALLARFREEPVHKHWLLGEDERFPGLPFVGAVSVQRRGRGSLWLKSLGQRLGFQITFTRQGSQDSLEKWLKQGTFKVVPESKELLRD